MKPELIKEIYKFEKGFDIPVLLEEIEEEEEMSYLQLRVELMLNHEEKTFVIDFNNPLDVNKGIIKLYGPNYFGNISQHVVASANFYRWIAEICDFADECLNKKSVKKK